MTLLERYQCGKPVHELSIRSRCVECEHQRGDFNEAEIEKLRTAVYNVVERHDKYITAFDSHTRVSELAEAVYALKKVLKG